MSDNFNNSNNLPERSSPPHNNNDNNNGDDEPSGIPIACQVCGARAIGHFYGADTCIACKSFFPYSAKKKFPPCKNNGQCMKSQLLMRLRHFRPCRLQKCIDVGMNLEGFQLRPLPNPEMSNTMQQRVQEQANHSTSPSVSYPFSVSSSVAHCSSTPPSSSDPNLKRGCVTACPKTQSNMLPCGLDPPSGDPGIESQGCSSSARSDQRLQPNECNEDMGLEDTVSTGAPQAPSLTDTSSNEDLHVTAESRLSSEQQEKEAEEPLDLSKKE